MKERRHGSPGPKHTRFTPSIEIRDFTSDVMTLEIHNSRFAELLEGAQSTRREAAAAAPIPGLLTPSFQPQAPSQPPRTPVLPPAAPPPPPKEISNETVRRRMATMPRDANPDQELRFVVAKCEIQKDGLVGTMLNGRRLELRWADIAAVYVRRLPHEPPWERALVMDFAPRAGAPIRVMSSTIVNFMALPGGPATSHLENCRRLAALAAQQNPGLSIDPETHAFVSGSGPCPALAGIEQFLRYDDRFA